MDFNKEKVINGNEEKNKKYYSGKKPESLKDLKCRTVIINGITRKFYY
jgi:hypothetical protein